MAKAKSEETTKPKSQLVREAIEKLVGEKREVTTAAILTLLQDAGLKDAKPMDIYQSPDWKELREREKSGAAPASPKTEAKETVKAPERVNGRITKSEAIRRAFGKLGHEAKPSAVIEFTTTKFGIVPSSQLVSNFKSKLAKKEEVKRGPGRPPKAQAVPAPTPRPVKIAPMGDISMDDLRSVKELVDRIGADKVRQLAQVLA